MLFGALAPDLFFTGGAALLNSIKLYTTKDLSIQLYDRKVVWINLSYPRVPRLFLTEVLWYPYDQPRGFQKGRG